MEKLKNQDSDQEGTDHEDHNEFADQCKKQLSKLNKKYKNYPGEEGQEYDQVLSDIFHKVLPGEGDEFAAVKPWLGAIKEPKPKPKITKQSKEAPAENFEIDWVFGYRNEEARNNAFFNSEGHAVYPTATLGVIFDYTNMSQKYFGGGETSFKGRKQDDESQQIHTDDITALSISQSRKIVVTGQTGQSPIIFVWDAITGKVIAEKRLPKGSEYVTAICISPDEKKICASDSNPKGISVHTIVIKDQKAEPVTVKIGQKVTHIAWDVDPKSQKIAVVGKDTFGIVEGGKIEKSTGKTISHCAVAWLTDSKYSGQTITGGADGNLYHWIGTKAKSNVANNKGPVQTVVCQTDSKLGEIVLAGGNDKSLKVYKFEGELKVLWNLTVDAVPRSLDLLNSQILIGQKDGSLIQMPLAQDGTEKKQVIMTSHCDGEVWGLCVITLDDKSIRCITSADDNRLLAYNAHDHVALTEGKIMAPPAKKEKDDGKFKGGASSMSEQPSQCQSRAIAYCHKLKHLAVANNTGIVTIRLIDWKKVDSKEKGALDDVKFTTKCYKDEKKARSSWIEMMVYSPCSNFLAVGSHDQTIYVMDTKKYEVSKTHKILKSSSAILNIDWSLDSSYLRTVDEAYEYLFYTFNDKEIKQDPSGASNTVSTKWADQKCKLGWNVQGIFPPGCGGSHINSCCFNKDQSLIASGDDWGLLRTYRNPLLEGHESKMYRGHSEHVTRVMFSDDSQFLFSVGGQDQTFICWRKV